ncbi:MAG: membrane protein insertion efficiency factor YidD [Candidatus Omnitrophica bacterium]|nr:membrane protein insertion efficiency factor YidD [Candidatus Omnitrophota bacterium]
MKSLILWLITLYQKGISPCLPRRCRFYPSCSQYAWMAVQANGVFWGLLYTFKRLLRCHPFSDGGADPPPIG